jgi:transposase InsO family protein
MYLLRSATVKRPNQIWTMDITYIPMARGFVYLTAVVDWFTRRVLAHRERLMASRSGAVGKLPRRYAS